MRRFVFVMAFALAIGVGTVMAVPAGSSAATVIGATCSSARFFPVTISANYANCTNPVATGGKGHEAWKFAKSGVATGTFTWNKTGTTTVSFISTAGNAAQDAVCAHAYPGDHAVIFTGKVTGGTGAALKGLPKGSKFRESICDTFESSVYLYPGSKVSI